MKVTLGMSKRDACIFLAGLLWGGAATGGLLVTLSLLFANEMARSKSPSKAAAISSSEFQGHQYAFDGYCPVTLVEKSQWKLGKIEHLERREKQVFLFAGASEQQLFRQNPDRYIPAFSGNDIVLAAESHTTIAGEREHGIMLKDRIYLFATEESLQRFARDPASYVARTHEAPTQNAAKAVGDAKK